MGFGVVVPVVGGGVVEREREKRQWEKVIEIREKGKRDIILYYFLLYIL